MRATRSSNLLLLALTCLLLWGFETRAAAVCEEIFARGGGATVDFRAPAIYVDKIKLLQEPPGGEPLGQIVSKSLNSAPDYTGSEFRAEFGERPPNAIKHLFPSLGTRAFIKTSSVNPEVFYRAVYSNYGNNFSKELMSSLSTADKNLLFDRTSLGVVRDRHSITGTWRWYEANPILSGSKNKNPRVLPKIPVELPFQFLNRARGVADLKIAGVLKSFMDRGVGVTEISKFSAVGKSESVRARTVHMIELQWKVMAKADDIYIAHVTTLAHARLYKKYGFEIAERFDVVDPVTGKSHPEAILWVRGWQFERALENCVGVIGQTSNLRPAERLLPAEFRDPNFHVRD